MTTIAYPAGQVYVGVDTHSEVHVAVAKDELGRHLGEISVASTLSGHRSLHLVSRAPGLMGPAWLGSLPPRARP
jgi:hypothetical protein